MAASFLAVLNHTRTQWHAIGIDSNHIQHKKTNNFFSNQNPEDLSMMAVKTENPKTISFVY